MGFIYQWISIVLFVVLVGCAPATNGSKDSRQAQADMHFKLAAAHLQNNNPTYALKELLSAVELDPDNSEIHVALAQAYQKKNAYNQAETHYFKALSLSPDNPRYQNNLGALYLDMKQWDQAIEYFDKAAANLLFLNVHIAVTGKGYAYFQKQNYPQALAAYKEAERLAPRYAIAYFYESEVYRVTGQSDKEQIALSKVIDLAPQYLDARYRFAVLLAQNNDLAGAREQLQTIINRAPVSEIGVKARDMLKVLK